jgi:hypothetical protein
VDRARPIRIHLRETFELDCRHGPER